MRLSPRTPLGPWLVLCLLVLGGTKARAQAELTEPQALQALDVQTMPGAWQEAGPELAQTPPASLDINRASPDELLALPGATPAGIAALLRYRQQYGGFAELSELNAVPGLSTAEAQALAPYLLPPGPARAPIPLRQVWAGAARPWLLIRTQRQGPLGNAYTKPDFAPGSNYAGGPWGTLVRLRGNAPQRLSYGLVLEKDPGEAWQPAPGRPLRADYASATLVLRNRGAWKAIALADYQLAFGQGLAFGRSFLLGRGAEPVLTLAQPAGGILPYHALVEGRALRGAAFTRTLAPGLELHGFGSYKRVDARPIAWADSLATQLPDAVGPPRFTGLHRTRAELATRRNLPEWLGGTALQWAPRQGFGHLGLLMARQAYDAPLAGSPLPPGLAQTQNLASAWYRTRYRSLAAFGEATLRQGIPLGGVQVLQWMPTPHTALGLAARHLPAGIAGAYGQPYAQRLAGPAGEQGLLLAAQQRLGRWALAAYQDYYRPLQANPGQPFASPAAEWSLQATYAPRKTAEALLQLRARSQAAPMPAQADPSASIPAGQTLYGVAGLRYQPWPSWQLAGQLRTCHGAAGQGWALYQQVQVRYGPLRATLRAYAYSTAGFGSRLLFFEPGVLYQPRLVSAYGQGTRLMALLDATLPHWGNLYLKAAHTQPLSGPPTWELTLQARIWLSKGTQLSE